MSESFIYYIWQYQYFRNTELTTTSGDAIHVFSPGQRNADAGPDFINARIKVGEIQWIGSVEIHVEASDWYQHHHQNDEGYDNVILHVVWLDNTPVYRRDGSLLPTLELKSRVDEALFLQYRKLISSIETVPCASALPDVKPLVILNTLDRMVIERTELKAEEVLRFVDRNKGDWEETCYQLLARNFGFKINSEPFLQLALSLPLKILRKHSDKLIQLEAMLFGVAGFLEDDIDDAYYFLLKREYDLLRKKYRLDHKEMKKVQWKFLRLRPANFPTLRIAQFAILLHQQQNIFSSFRADDGEDLLAIFRNDPSPYWSTHYNFQRQASPKDAVPGESSISNLVINTVVPMLAAFSIFKDDQKYMDKAVSLLQFLPPESNRIITKWTGLSVKCKNAFDSQALIGLFNNFCSRHRCLECNIGASLIKPVKN